ncbi:potassium/sodium hyperpolarization-activated cyclic nucleotide-gated channel 1-like isoform X2 [Physella acuta]|uniref:potassium/sodium hyperpolarization-activated cyclic nucleotide-gated channel 1-like isoform X2 n=1 Tax=Physella acuta TaxID=109671 RepID=UPI0027DE7C1D|nr:potassium/sodium hyperpolarization-activated cyclic nucleotide-gated channel 1-like isoform X2 [Physella acuta]
MIWDRLRKLWPSWADRISHKKKSSTNSGCRWTSQKVGSLHSQLILIASRRPSDNLHPSENPRPSDNLHPSENPRPSDNLHPSENPRPSDNLHPSENPRPSDMDRQRSHRRSSFRMRISRRMRAEFTPIPQHESDSDVGREPHQGEGRRGGAVKKDGVKKKEDSHSGHKDGGHDAGSDVSRKSDVLVTENFTDLNVELDDDLGKGFRHKRRSFGSESEKRRGERFQRREIEKRVTLDESDGLDSSSQDSHVCDLNCPLVNLGQCPNAQASRLKAPRRSSLTSSSSLNKNGPHGRRLRPLASLSIDDVSSGDPVAGPQVRSPGLLSTASMWSTSDLHLAGLAQAQTADAASHGGTNSLSNVSGSFSERMHELVRAFSSRTQRAKEKISQPPTPSSESDLDAKSVSGGEQAPRNIRLGSFLPMGSRTSDAFSDENHDHFVGVWHCKFKTPKFLKRLRFPATIEPHSKTYVTWLFFVALAFMYNAVVIPLRGVFPYQTDDNVRYWLIADYICDFIYLIDICLFKVRLRFANDGIVETNRAAIRQHYMKKWMFKFDIMSLMPLDLFYLIQDVGVNSWLRLPRMLKIQTYWEFYERCDQASRSSAHAIRIVKTMAYMLFLIHIETCGYYAMSVHEGIGSNEWVYNGKGIAYIRCFYLATKTATSIGNNPTPQNIKEYLFMTVYWLSGVFVFALLIGQIGHWSIHQIRDIVEAAGMVKDNYRKKMDSCLWYMQSINLPQEMKDKVREWFLYNWNQQKTIDERSLVVSLPKKLQTDLAINVHFNTLSKVQLFQDCERNLLYDLVLKLKPILYLPGDYICQKGEVGKEMYIVTQGQVEVVGGENNSTVLATLHEGSVFGEISLLAMSGRGNRRTADVRCKGYTNVFTLSKHDFEMAMTEYPDAQAVLKKRAKKLLKANAKMEKKHKKVEAEEIIKTSPETPKLLQTVIQVMDPDSNLVKHLTPSTQPSQRKRPHSRSHSHRLSPSTSNLNHLTPPRSLSYRLANRAPTDGVNNLTHDGYDTDEDNDDPLVYDSSDDVSLSEVLHDAGAISSFEDDESNAEDQPRQDLRRKKSSDYFWSDTVQEQLNDTGSCQLLEGQLVPSEVSNDADVPGKPRNDSSSSTANKENSERAAGGDLSSATRCLLSENATEKSMPGANGVSTRMEKLAPPPLILSSTPLQEISQCDGRQRKLSVVSLPPASPRDSPQWVTTSFIGHRSNGSNPIPHCTVEAVKSMPPIETTRSIWGNSLTNGLEGCCGAGPLMEIPAENRITCAVEVHRQKTFNSSTSDAVTITDIHGHTETML